jgi:hypothetical protein
MFPTILKYAEIKPLLKKWYEYINYRPVYLVTSFSKVFEKVIYVRLYQHLNTNNILVNEQFGFRTKLSIVKATFNLISEILDALNNKKTVSGIFCNQEKGL